MKNDIRAIVTEKLCTTTALNGAIIDPSGSIMVQRESYGGKAASLAMQRPAWAIEATG